MEYDVTLNGLTQAQAVAWAADMVAHGHKATPRSMAPVAPASAAPVAAPAQTVPVNGLAYTPPSTPPLVWARSDNGNGYKAPDPVLKGDRGAPLVWLYNDDARPLANGHPGSYVVKARVMGSWLTFDARAELVARFAPTGGFPAQPAPARRRR